MTVELSAVDLRRASAGILDGVLGAAREAVLTKTNPVNWGALHASIDRAERLHDMSLRRKGATVTENA